MLIWWLSSEDIASIRRGGPVPLELPDYIREAVLDLQGRAGRGRLWGTSMASARIDPNHPGWDTPLGEVCQRLGGIVVRDEDVGALATMPGLITDLELRRAA